MFASFDNVLHICYELSIFLLFALLASNLFIKHVLPSIYEMIKEAQKKHEDLENLYQLTKNTIARVENSTEKQSKNLKKLEDKVRHWNTQLIEDQKKLTEDLQKIVNRINMQRKRQTKLLHDERLQREALPMAIDLARNEFTKHSKNEGRKILTDLIINLEKGLAKNEK